MIAPAGKRGTAFALAALAIGLILVAGCQTAGRRAGEGQESARHLPDASVIDPQRLGVGDTLLGLRVAAMEMRSAPADSEWIGEARFDGAIALSGEYGPHFDYPEPPALCFFPDSASAARLPRLANDERDAWFCFANADTAREWLGEPTPRRAARVVIDRYHYVFSHTDVYNTARLVQVMR